MQTGKSFLSIYTHWDGYPSHHGRILLGHYAKAAQVRELLKLGDLSSLGEEIGEKHGSDPKPAEAERWCTAYERDRGDTDTRPCRSKTLEELLRLAGQTNSEYTYLFLPSGWVFNNGGPGWKDLIPEVVKERLTA